MRREVWVWWGLAGGAIPAPAEAALLASDGTRTVQVLRRDHVFLLNGPDGTQTLEMLEISGGPRRVVWFRPHPGTVEFWPVSSEAFDGLMQNTVAEKPFRDAVEARALGPSLLARWVGPPGLPSPSPPPELARLVGRTVISGPVTTSTESGQWTATLPPALTDFLQTHGVSLPEGTRSTLARHLIRGRRLEASAWTLPAGAERVRLGPLGVSHSERPAWWEDLADSNQKSRVVVLSDRTWTPDPPRRAALPTESLGAGALRWERVGPLTGSEAARLPSFVSIERPVVTRWEGRPRDPSGARVSLTPAQVATLPPVQAGGFADLFACLLLGLTPLILAPESWVLLYLQAAWRERYGPNRAWPLSRMWSGWALATAIFYWMVLPGVARLAVALPLAVGLWTLVTRDRPRRLPMRVTFARSRQPSNS